jgi:mRNA-degrading endonuclease RelE of RelBE toxin-antitoxin system
VTLEILADAQRDLVSSFRFYERQTRGASVFGYHRSLSKRFRARAGDYRAIYTFDLRQNIIHLLAIGHRREIYR